LVTSNATFTASVATTAGETVTGFAWLMSSNGLGPFITVPAATTATCTITNLQTTNSGFYFVRVSYTSGTNQLTTASSSVQLTVQDQARITSQPQNLIRATGTSASFSVTALGELPLNYRWRFNGVELNDDARISGATSNTVTIANLVTNDSGSYDVVVTNLYGAATSQVATLSVFVPPFVGVPPQDLTIITGSNAVFTVTAGGSPPFGYRWKKNGANLFNGGRISGVFTDTLTIANAVTNDKGNYSVFISNIVGTIVSPSATLAVLIPPVITSPTNALGQQGHFFSYTATATGSPPITFGADGLPAGLNIEPTNGVISGIPSVFGAFDATLYATNAALTATQLLTITLITDVPGITSPLIANGKQGQFFTYTITASNDPVTFTATGLPLGLSFDPTTATISGPPVVSGVFPITIGAANQYGSDSQTLMLNLASALPVITSPLTATGTENATGFSYTITASNSPTSFGA
jgi:hypothetical protein